MKKYLLVEIVYGHYDDHNEDVQLCIDSFELLCFVSSLDEAHDIIANQEHHCFYKLVDISKDKPETIEFLEGGFGRWDYASDNYYDLLF